MSESPIGYTPAQFHAELSVDGWHVTSWGAQACFRSDSLASAARLVPVIVDAGAAFEVLPDVDLRPTVVIVRIPFHNDRIPLGAPQPAAAVTEAAASLGLQSAPELIQTVDIAVAQDPTFDTRPFWTAALGYHFQGDTDAVDPLRRGPSLSFQPLPKPGRGRTHVDVSVPAHLAEHRVAAALAAGGRLVDDSRAPMWWTLASPDNHGIDIAAWTDSWS